MLKLRAIGDTGGLERLLILSSAANPHHHRRRLKLRAARRGLLKLRTAASRRLKSRRIGGGLLLELVARHLLLQECRGAATLTAGRRLEGLAAGQLLVRNS